MGGFSFPIVFGAGVLSFLSPCVLPLVPPYLTYMSGASFDQLRDDHRSAFTRIASRHTAANAASGAGDQCYFPRQQGHIDLHFLNIFTNIVHF